MDEDEGGDYGIQDEESSDGGGSNSSQLGNKLKEQFTGKKKGKSGIRNKAKEAGQKAAKAVSDGIKNIWKSIPSKVKIIIIAVISAIILAATIVLLILEVQSETTVATSASYYDEDDIGAVENPEGSEFYQATGSFLLASDEDIKEMARRGIVDLAKSDADMSEYLEKKVEKKDDTNSGIKLENGAISLNEDISIYEHCLNAERYNFNRIKWVEYLRDELIADKNAPLMKVDEKSRLQYPADNTMQLKDIAYIVAPYLQSWCVPYGMLMGMATNTTNDILQNFVYAIIRDGYSQITMQKRNLESRTIVTEYKDYTLYKYRATVKRVCTANGVCSDSSPEYTLISDEVVSEKDKPVKVSEEIKLTTDYKIDTLTAFDTVEKYTYTYKKYDINEQPNVSSTSEEDFQEGKLPVRIALPSDAVSGEYYFNYDIKKGKKYIVTSSWSDSISLEETDKRTLTIDDVNEYTNEALSESDTTYYTKLADRRRLNYIDVINASSKTYSTYLDEGVEFTHNIGYSYNKLELGYNIIRNLMADNIEKNGAYYAYGSSLGLKVNAGAGLGWISAPAYDVYRYLKEYVWPVPDSGQINSYFGNRTINGSASNHTGIDIDPGGVHIYRSNVSGPYVYSASSGVVINDAKDSMCMDDIGYYQSNCGGGYGRHVRVQDENGFIIIYAHLYKINPDIKEGRIINKGDVIGVMGTTGSSTGVHLHFEIRNAEGIPIDPLPYVTTTRPTS